MKYILSGSPKEVLKVLQENRIRVERGLISFEPLPAEAELVDSKEFVEADVKDVAVSDEKKPKTAKRTKKSELC